MDQKLSSLANSQSATVGLRDPATTFHSLLILFPVLLAGYLMVHVESEFNDILFKAIADAYIQVSTFVAGTFFIFYGIERVLNIDAAAALRKATVWQVPIAAALGALPGCGGAIIVVTQYVSGRLSFGSVVAVLTATMGDAAFLLIAQQPLVGLAMAALGFVVGTLSGWTVNHIHGRDFLLGSLDGRQDDDRVNKGVSTPYLDRIWLIIMLPGLVLAVFVAFQVDVDALFATDYLNKPASLLGVLGGVLAVAMQLAPRFGIRGDTVFSASGTILQRTIADTNFVTVWVIGAYLVFDLSVYFFAIDLKQIFSGFTLFTPMIAILLGFLPGCGPQVLVTTMYLAGILPLSAQIGNALSNDGDALFPAIAIAPKVAVVATLYSAVPAVIVSYGWLFLVE
jgi:hypothetical protein